MNIEKRAGRTWRFVTLLLVITLILVAFLFILPLSKAIYLFFLTFMTTFIGIYYLGKYIGYKESKEWVDDSFEHNAELVANLVLIGTKVFLSRVIQKKLSKMSKLKSGSKRGEAS